MKIEQKLPISLVNATSIFHNFSPFLSCKLMLYLPTPAQRSATSFDPVARVTCGVDRHGCATISMQPPKVPRRQYHQDTHTYGYDLNFPVHQLKLKSGFPFSASCSFQQLLNIIHVYIYIHIIAILVYKNESISLRQIQSRITFISSFLFVLLLVTPVVEFQQKPKHQAPEALRDAFSNEWVLHPFHAWVWL